MSLLNHIQKAIALLAIAFLFGCKPNHSADELSQLNQELDSLSVEIANNVYITYTDSAILRATIKAPILKRFPDKKNPRMEMPNGVSAVFYDFMGDTTSTLNSKYAMHYEKEDKIEIRDSVRVVNRNDEEIKSDELIWDKKARRVTSKKPVRVRIRDEKIISAEGFESDESFLNYKFTRVTGVVFLDEDESTEE